MTRNTTLRPQTDTPNCGVYQSLTKRHKGKKQPSQNIKPDPNPQFLQNIKFDMAYACLANVEAIYVLQSQRLYFPISNNYLANVDPFLLNLRMATSLLQTERSFPFIHTRYQSIHLKSKYEVFVQSSFTVSSPLCARFTERFSGPLGSCFLSFLVRAFEEYPELGYPEQYALVTTPDT